MTNQTKYQKNTTRLPIAQQKLTYFPKDMAHKCVLVYILALGTVNGVFFDYAMPWWLWLFGIASVLLFFYGSNFFTKVWYNISEKSFAKNLFWWAFGIRIAYVLFIYFFNNEHYGTYYESNEGDITWYVPSALEMAKQFSEGNYRDVIRMWLGWNVDISDLGYIIYLAFLYLITGAFSEVVLPLSLKAVYGALMCVMMYRIAKRHFGEHVGRMTAIFCMLQANLIWWCGSMMKETEMTLLVVWYIYEMDNVLSRGSFKLQHLSKAIFIGFLLFTFRGALGLVAFGAMFVALLLTNSKIVNVSTKILVGVLLAVVLGLSYGENIMEMVQDVREKVEGGSYQATNMEWRRTRDGGNDFAKYASAVVFAPLIFTIPFPSMVYTYQSQEMQIMVNGGNFEKNILSFFVILILFHMIFSGEWRKHVFILVMLCGYLAALVLSVFAQSGRFHVPIMPIELMLTAYGIYVIGNTVFCKRWFNWVLALEVIVCVVWAWFKLAGRGWA